MKVLKFHKFKDAVLAEFERGIFRFFAQDPMGTYEFCETLQKAKYSLWEFYDPA